MKEEKEAIQFVINTPMLANLGQIVKFPFKKNHTS
jgi:hypothetical protein